MGETTEPPRSQKERYRHAFWCWLLEHADSKLDLHRGRTPGYWRQQSAALPLRGVGFDYVLGREHTRTELYLQRSEAAENLALFHALFQRKEELEEVFGSTLEWSPLPQRAGCRVRFRLEHGGWSDPGSWPAVVPATVDAMLRFSKALTEPVLTSGRRLGLR